MSKAMTAFNPFHNLKALFNPEDGHIGVLDFWRTIAMFWIVTKHTMQVIMAYRNNPQISKSMLGNPDYKSIFLAEFGVDIFFVLSGYLIGLIVLKEIKKNGRFDIIRFYIRRALRMFPIYYFILIAVNILRFLMISPYLWPTTDSWPNFLYINNFIDHKKQFLVFTWSLAIEEQFYLICPAIILLIMKMGWSFVKTFLLLISVIIGIHFLIVWNYDFATFWSPFPFLDKVNYGIYFDLLYDKPYIRFSSLFIGVIGSYWTINGYHKKLFSNKISSIGILFFSIALILFVSSIQDYSINGNERGIVNEILYRELFSIGFLGLIFSSLNIKLITTLLSGRIFYPIFQLSYGIYLIHPFVLRFLVKNENFEMFRLLLNYTSSNLYFYTMGLFVFSISAVIVIPIYILVERPFMNLRQLYFPSR